MSLDKKNSINNILEEKRIFPPSKKFAENSNISTQEELLSLKKQASDNPIQFWESFAKSELDWFEPFQTVLDTENADLAMEKEALEKFPEEELLELAAIYEKRGLDSNLALEVAKQMTAHNALEAHARDEIGITDELSANPLQAAFWSAFAFVIGGVIPVFATWTINLNYIHLIPILIPILTIILLAILGAIAGYISGASCLRGALRVCFWGIIAMSLTYLVGNLFNTSLI